MGYLSKHKKLIVFVIVLFFGYGALWEYKNIEILKIKESVEIREKMQPILVQIINLSQEYSKLTSENKGINKRNMLISQIRLLEKNFIAYEKKLSILEDRQPEKINLDFIPPGPITDLSIK